MAENTIGLKSVSDILGMNFFIPSYQRGYRWDKQQVEDLLDDVWEFLESDPKKDEWYCLQPVILKPKGKQWEVIDGQQRLTTIFLVLKHLEKFVESERKTFELEYETRNTEKSNSKDFLNKVETMSKEKSLDNIDYFHIYNAFVTIKEWFKEKAKTNNSVSSKFITPFLEKTKVIWYETAEDDAVKIFTRINMGKIPLTNAELIKALFLQNRGSIVESQQTIIANEWDKIEYALQNEEFWWFLNKDKNDMPARIEFLFDLICDIEKQKDKKAFESKYGTDKYTTFRFFNDKFTSNMTFDKVKAEWDVIHEYFLAFQEWYNTPVWYHYIGFLIYCKTPVIEIYNLYGSKAKEDFTKGLIEKIKSIIKNIPCEKHEDDYLIDLPFENKNKEQIRRLLLLFNIEFINKQYIKTTKQNQTQDDDNLQNQTQDDDNFIIKFPFKLFKNENWDVEHIDSQTPNTDDEKDWLQTAREDLSEELKGEYNRELANDIEDFLNNKNTQIQFADLYKEICKLYGETENDEETKNSIGNLTLLNADINRSYGNALFPTKRRIIIKKDMEGKFIPICTKHVFLKYFDNKGTSRTKWGKEDIQNYQNHIGTILNDFLTIKNQQGGQNDE